MVFLDGKYNKIGKFIYILDLTRAVAKNATICCPLA
jgi:hypothetical protein